MPRPAKFLDDELIKAVKEGRAENLTFKEISDKLNIPAGTLTAKITGFRKRGLLPPVEPGPVPSQSASQTVLAPIGGGIESGPTPARPAKQKRGADPLRSMIRDALKTYKKAVGGGEVSTQAMQGSTRILIKYGYLEEDNKKTTETQAHYAKMSLHELRNKVKVIQAAIDDELGTIQPSVSPEDRHNL